MLFTSEPKCEVEGCGRRAETEIYADRQLRKICSSHEINLQEEQEEQMKLQRRELFVFGKSRVPA